MLICTYTFANELHITEHPSNPLQQDPVRNSRIFEARIQASLCAWAGSHSQHSPILKTTRLGVLNASLHEAVQQAGPLT